MKYSLHRLSNGLTVLEVPSTDAESVVVDFFVKTGSRSETEKENGISHFLEHFLFKGTKKYPSALAISTLVDSIGGFMNASTGKEYTQYFIKASSQHLRLIFEVLTDMMQNPLFDAAELEREKGVIVEEINMYKDTPSSEVGNVLEAAMWPKTALGRDIAGTSMTVTKFTREMFVDYIRRHYQTPNIILGVAGKYDQKLFDSLIKKYWEKIPGKAFHGWSKVADDQNRTRAAITYKKTEQAHLILGAKGLPYTDKRDHAQMALSAILGGGMSSRLFIQVRERRGLAYYVGADASHYQDTGLFAVSAGVKVKKIKEALKVIASELRKLKHTRVAGQELKKAKDYLKGRTTLGLENNFSKLDWYLEQVAFDKEIISPAAFFRRIDKVTPAEIQKLAQVLFSPKKLTLAVIGPYRNQEKSFLRLIK